MRSPGDLRARAAVIVALELLGMDEPAASSAHPQQVIALLQKHLRHGESGSFHEHRLLIAGCRALCIASITRGGPVLFLDLVDLARLQVALAQQQICVRGALTLGNAASIDETIVGPGTVEAEQMRDDVAQFPRIVVAPRLLLEIESSSRLRGVGRSAPEALGYIRQLLRVDSDGVWFIDYLGAFGLLTSDPDYSGMLDGHRRLIERQLKAATGLDRASRIWTWLWSYHNQIIEDLHDKRAIDDEARARLRLPAPAPLTYVFPPSAKIPG